MEDKDITIICFALLSCEQQFMESIIANAQETVRVSDEIMHLSGNCIKFLWQNFPRITKAINFTFRIVT